jgi:hypothetical protein
MPENTHPSVVDIFSLYATATRKLRKLRKRVLTILMICHLLPRDHGHEGKSAVLSEVI